MANEVQLVASLRQILAANPPTFNPSAELNLQPVGELGSGGMGVAAGVGDDVRVWRFDPAAATLAPVCTIPLGERLIAVDWNQRGQLACGVRSGVLTIVDLPALLGERHSLADVLQETGLTQADLDRELGR